MSGKDNTQMPEDGIEKRTEQNYAETDIYTALEQAILTSNFTPEEKRDKIAHLARTKRETVNILLVGASAVGKSSTINAMFNMEKAVVGEGVDPETKTMNSYELENLVLWDSPGLGDSIEADKKYMKMIRDKLNERDSTGKALVDLVLVILDSSQKDLGTTYDCINNVLVPTLGKEEAAKRIIVALNQADMGLKGTHWNTELNAPDLVLTEFLEKKAESVARRLFESTGIRFYPVYYAAGFKEPGEKQKAPYNLTKLLLLILESIPKEKRLVIANVLNHDKNCWKYTDGKKNYSGEILKKVWESVKDGAAEYAGYGVEIGVWIMGAPGGVLGGLFGGLVGSLVGAVRFLQGY